MHKATVAVVFRTSVYRVCAKEQPEAEVLAAFAENAYRLTGKGLRCCCLRCDIAAGENNRPA